MDALKELLLYIWDWLVANPPWLIGIVAAVAVLLWWVMHILPCKKREKYYEQKLLEGLQREQRRDDTAKQLRRQQEQAQARKESAGLAFELRTVALLQDGLADWLDSGRAKLLHNVELPHAQIDVLLIDTSGIYVIECKCWSGIVLGKQGWPFWLRIFCDFENGVPKVDKDGQGFQCNAFRNPIEQNKWHQKNLSQYLEEVAGREYKVFKQISVFDRCGNLEFLFPSETKPGDYRSQYTWFGSKDDLLDKIRWYDSTMKDENRLSQDDVDGLNEMLKSFVAPVA